MAVVENELWIEFFQEFSNYPELWKVKSSVYKNKDLRNKAWVKLLPIYKTIYSGATILSLKNKINNLKTCYRRELKKVLSSEKSGAGADEVYVPSLWYFDLLHFLRDNEIQVAGVSSLDSDDDIQQIEVNTSHQRKRFAHTKSISNDKNKFLQKAINHLDDVQNKLKEDGDVFAESWALSFKMLTSEQKLYAKKAIDEILVLGQLQQLTLNVVPPISPVCSSVNSPFILSRTSTPNTDSPATFEYSNTSGINPEQSNVAVHSVGNPVYYEYQSVEDLITDTQYY